MATLRDWLTAKGLQDVVAFSPAELAQPWDPSPEDGAAAGDLFVEMQNRIVTQHLHYRSGIEKTALESVYSFFEFTRTLSEDNNPKCPCFDFLADLFLEKTVRTFTASWHRTSEAGGFAQADVCRQFRRELLALQAKVRPIHRLVAALANKNYAAPSIVERDFVGLPLAPGALQGVANTTVLTEEKKEIVKRRTEVLNDNSAEPANLVGLAISGGGIRSATFATGVIQCLAEKQLLTAVDYLSTVSGGGYIGSFLSSYLNSSLAEVGTKADQLPFKKVENNEAAPIRHMRNHSKYLAEGSVLDLVRTAGQMAYGVLTNVVIIFPFIVLLATITFWAQRELISQAMRGTYTIKFTPVTEGLLAILAGLVVFLAIVQNLGRIGPWCHWWRNIYEWVTVGFLVLGVGALLYELQPAVFAGFHWLVDELPTWSHMAAAFATPPALGALLVLLKSRPIIGKILLTIFWLTGPIAFLLLYFGIVHELVQCWQPGQGQVAPPCWLETPVSFFGMPARPWYFWLLVDLGAIVYGFLFLNINMTSPHTFYRNRLASAYLLKAAEDTTNIPPTVKTAPNAAQVLSELNTTSRAPYHLINGALNLSNCAAPELRGRQSDFFLFSKHFCGSPILGYFPTRTWEGLDSHLNLATAMAISGAAAAPIMGMASIIGASFMLAILNVRLAYWLRDPNPAKWMRRGVWPAFFRGPGPVHLLREMFAMTNEKGAYVNVSDGGHLENLGVYELLRRKCKFIIAIDGECDEAMVFPSLMRVIRFAKIDFGIDIDIDLNDLRLDAKGLSKAHSAVGTIDYGSGQRGLLLYIKASLTGNEPDYVKAYKAKEPAFPHESTAKQLFAEDQFEAYRAVGHHAASDLFQPELMITPLPPNAPLSEWFKRLANSLFSE